MSEPVVQVSYQQVLAILGAKEVERIALLEQVAALQAQLQEAKKEPEKKKK